MTRRRPSTSDALGATTTPEAMDRRTIRATTPANRQEPDILDGQTICEHGSAAPHITNTVSAVQEPAASGAPAPELCPEAHAFAMLIAQATYAHILRTRQEADPRLLPSAVGQLPGAPVLGVVFSSKPAGVPDMAPAGAVGDGGGRADRFIAPTVSRKSRRGAVSNRTATRATEITAHEEPAAG